MIKNKYLAILFILMACRTYAVDVIVPGGGYESYTDSSRSKCLNGVESYGGSPFGIVNIDRSISYKELEAKVSATLGAGRESEKFSTKSSMEFVQNTRSTTTSDVFRFYSEFKLKNKIFTHTGFNDVGLNAISSGDGYVFRAVCGDEFAQEIELGGSLYLAISLDFSSEDEYQKFKSDDNSGDKSILTIERNITQESFKKKYNGKIRITAHQIGGDPAKLSSLMGVGMARECSFKEPSACILALDSLREVANSFSQGFEGDPNSTTTGPAELGYVMKSYDMIGQSFPRIPDIEDENVVLIRERISQYLDVEVSRYARYQRLHDIYSPLFYDNALAEIKDAIQDSKNNIANIKRAGYLCWSEPASCSQVLGALEGGIPYKSVYALVHVVDIQDPLKIPEIYPWMGYPYTSSIVKNEIYSTSNEGGGVAVFDIDFDGVDDILESFIDNPAYSNSLNYRIGLGAASGNFDGQWIDKKIVGSTGFYNQGSDVDLVNIDGDPRPDAVFAYIDNPSGWNSAFYKVCWNMTAAGDFKSCGSSVKIPKTIGVEHQGAGISVADINGNGVPDIIFMYVDNPSGANYAYYTIGWDVSGNGIVQGGWSAAMKIPFPLGYYTAGGSIVVADMDNNGDMDLVFAFIDNPSGMNTYYYSIGYSLNRYGEAREWTSPIAVGNTGYENSGAGVDVLDLDGDSLLDIVYYYIDDVPGGGKNTVNYGYIYRSEN